jgi:hypothetical protein
VLLLDPAAPADALRPYALVEHRVPFLITVEGRRLTADFAPRAVRKVLGAIAEHGTDGVVCMVQGRLLATAASPTLACRRSRRPSHHQRPDASGLMPL